MVLRSKVCAIALPAFGSVRSCADISTRPFPESGEPGKLCYEDCVRKSLFFDLETALHKREVRSSPKAAEFLANEFVEFGSSGRVYDKPAIIEKMNSENGDPRIVVEDFRVRELAPDVVLVTYKSKPARSQEATALRSSIWKRIGGRWQIVFHQGTRVHVPKS